MCSPVGGWPWDCCSSRAGWLLRRHRAPQTSGSQLHGQRETRGAAALYVPSTAEKIFKALAFEAKGESWVENPSRPDAGAKEELFLGRSIDHRAEGHEKTLLAATAHRKFKGDCRSGKGSSVNPEFDTGWGNRADDRRTWEARNILYNRLEIIRLGSLTRDTP